MKKLFCFLVAIAFAIGISDCTNADLIFSYDASAGGPTLPGDVENPITDQAWAAFDGSLGGTDIQEGVIESGVAAWRNLDGTNNNNPGYTHELSGTDYQEMYDDGWVMEMVIRLEQGGHFFSWGGDASNTVGNFAFGGDRRAGFSLGASGNDYTIAPTGTGSSTVTVTDGILNDKYIRVVARGAAGDGSGYTVNIFDADGAMALLSTQTITAFANGNSQSDSNLAWQSGSSGGDNREAFVRSFTLNSVPEPSSLMMVGICGIAMLMRRRK